MTEGELVTRVMAYTENVDPQDADYRPRRRRIVAWTQEVWDEIWQAFDWSWRRGRATIALATGDYEVALPDDFGNIPSEGGVYDGAVRYEDVSQYFTAGGREGEFSPPTYSFSLYNYSTTSNRPTIQFPTVGPRTLTMYYNQKPPLLADRPLAGYPTVAENGAGALTGTFVFRVTYVTADGIEHLYGDSTSITVVAKQMTITGPDPGPLGEHNVVSINLYRTLAAGSVYYKLFTWEAGISWTPGTFPILSDNTADAVLVLNDPLAAQTVLARIPTQYHHTVILPGVISRARRSKGDTRDWAGDYQNGLRRMITQERQRKSAIQRMPRAIVGMW